MANTVLPAFILAIVMLVGLVFSLYLGKSGQVNQKFNALTLRCNNAWPSSVCEPVLTSINASADPCEDFYEFACGGWMANTNIPSDRSSVSMFSQLDDRTKLSLRKILNSSWPLIQPFYKSCMDLPTIETVGIPGHMRKQVDEVKADVTDLSSLMSFIGSTQWYGVTAFFDMYIGASGDDPTLNLLRFDTGGLTMDYDRFENQTVVGWLQDYVVTIMTLYGEDQETANRIAANTVAVEKAIAAVTPPPGSIRDPREYENRFTLEQLKQEFGGLDWEAFIRGMGIKITPSMQPDLWNVDQTKYTKDVSDFMAKAEFAQLKDYFIWHVVRSQVWHLNKEFRDASHEFFRKQLYGIEDVSPRWEDCSRYTDNYLGDLLSHYYALQYFPQKSKDAVDVMVDHLGWSLFAEFEAAGWMDEPTRIAAEDKLSGFLRHVGYPSKWKDFEGVSVAADTFYMNLMELNKWSMAEEIGKLYKPVDPEEWYMTTPTINAYYDPSTNSINFPAGILQPPMFGGEQPSAVNFGGMGSVIGHEMSHGFDDQGRMFDKQGKLNDWWSEASADNYEGKTKCLEKQYSGYSTLSQTGKTLQNNGTRTLGENIADNVGTKISFSAWKNYTAVNGEQPPLITGLTNEQLFFTAYGQAWCAKMKDEVMVHRINNDVHSAPMFRVLGTLSNLKSFTDAFKCKSGSKYNSKRCSF
eukprot:TRINITY_DN48101_c0_g1_i1.p1 TRINITY_DN48101_c0_g1~~TRINITY_DN48101_c0_g1_i1.p1  ORF type:complete len:693 (-),score=80.41 TRINITY_DN48101_c0_g1_i1:268-2346(-)